MNEKRWDELLGINTIGRDDSKADDNHHPYEPTPYTVLERLAESRYVSAKDVVIDYGCGKGRVGFFLNHELGCETIGVEYDRKIYEQAVENLRSYRGKVRFVCENAEIFQVDEANCFYFFNPFTEKILQSVLGRILESYYENPRYMKFFFYYPDEAYVSSLMTMDEMMFLDEVDCRDLFDGKDEREKILVFELGSEDVYE